MKKAHAERQRGRPGVWIFLGISIFAYGKSEILAEASTIFHNIIKSSVFLEKAETKKEDKPKTKIMDWKMFLGGIIMIGAAVLFWSFNQWGYKDNDFIGRSKRIGNWIGVVGFSLGGLVVILMSLFA